MSYFKLIMVFLAIVIAISFIACSDSSTDPKDKQPDAVVIDTNLVGQWDARYLLLQTESGTQKVDVSWEPGLFGDLILAEDGTFSYDFSWRYESDYMYGKWTAKDGILTLTSDSNEVLKYYYGLVKDREYVIPFDSIMYDIRTTKNGDSIDAKVLFRKRLEFTKDTALLGKWTFFSMDITQDDQTITVTKNDLYINYTLDFQSSWFRSDSIVSGNTVIFTDDNWYVYKDLIETENDFQYNLWKYKISSDTLNIKFYGIHEDKNAFFSQSFAKKK